jgi:large subunit ribosomal protein L9
MQVLLIQDVDNLGYAGEVKKVANGFGRNYLIPQNLAVVATPGALKQAETIRKAAEKHRAQAMADAQAIANQLVGVQLLFERRAGETGKLYGSVTSGDIAEAVETKTGIAIDKRKVALPEPIRSLGEQTVTIKLMIDVSATIKVEVLPLGGVLERERLSEAEQAKIEAEAAPPEAATAEAVVDDTPVDETSAEIKAEVDDAPVSETEPEAAAEAPAVETPVDETPAEIEAEVDDAPVSETEPEAAAEAPAVETPVGETRAEVEAEDEDAETEAEEAEEDEEETDE